MNKMKNGAVEGHSPESPPDLWTGFDSQAGVLFESAKTKLVTILYAERSLITSEVFAGENVELHKSCGIFTQPEISLLKVAPVSLLKVCRDKKSKGIEGLDYHSVAQYWSNRLLNGDNRGTQGIGLCSGSQHWNTVPVSRRR